MPRDAQVTFRLPKELRDEIRQIADETRRSLSNTLELLLMRGIEAYKQDGILLDTRTMVKGESEAPAGSLKRKAG
jgi:hypothetical protein